MKTKKTILLASSSMLAAGMAQGAIYYNNLDVTIGTSSSGYSFDLNGDGINDYTMLFDANNGTKPCIVGVNSSSGSYPGSFPNPIPMVFNELNMNPGYPANPGSNDNNGVPVITDGTTISSQISVGAYTLTMGDLGGDQHGKNEGYLYQNGENQTVGQWPANQDTVGYVALAMVDTTLGTTNYGWVQLDYNGPNSTMTILGTAYQTTPDTPIVTPVPEPATLTLTGLAGALLVLAKRKKAKLNP